jgi:hypothetical protein
MGSGFFFRGFQSCWPVGYARRSPAHFIKGLRAVDQIDPKEMILPLVVIDVDEGGCEKSRLHPVDRAVKEVGKGPWRNSGERIRGDAH